MHIMLMDNNFLTLFNSYKVLQCYLVIIHQRYQMTRDREMYTLARCQEEQFYVHYLLTWLEMMMMGS